MKISIQASNLKIAVTTDCGGEIYSYSAEQTSTVVDVLAIIGSADELEDNDNWKRVCLPEKCYGYIEAEYLHNSFEFFVCIDISHRIIRIQQNQKLCIICQLCNNIFNAHREILIIGNLDKVSTIHL